MLVSIILLSGYYTSTLIDRLGLKETLAEASGARWLGHVMRRDEGNVLRKALTFEIDGLKKKSRPKFKLKNKIVSEISEVGLKEKDTFDRKKWRLGIFKIAKMFCKWSKSGRPQYSRG